MTAAASCSQRNAPGDQYQSLEAEAARINPLRNHPRNIDTTLSAAPAPCATPCSTLTQISRLWRPTMNLSVSLACRKLTSLFTVTFTSLLLTLALAGIFANAQTASTSTSVTATSSSGDWTQFLNNSMQRWNPYENILGVNNAGSLQLKWTQTTTGAFYSDLVVANGVVYVSGGNGKRQGAMNRAAEIFFERR